MPRLTQVTGATGCGKSTLVKQLVGPLPRAIVISAFGKNDYAELPGGCPRFNSLDHLTQTLKQRRPRTFRVSVSIGADELAQLCRLAWVIAPVALVFDETYQVFENAASIPREFVAVVQGGRHAGFDEQQEISVIAIGQRPINLPPVFRAEVQEWFLFQLKARKDRKLLEDDFGLPKEVAERAGKLPRFHYMKVDNWGAVTYGQTSR